MTLKQVEERLSHDENAWLKHLGEMGDIARLIERSFAENARLQTQITNLQVELAKVQAILKVQGVHNANQKE